MGVRQQIVWNIENGTTWPDFVTLAGLCEVLDFDLATIHKSAVKDLLDDH